MYISWTKKSKKKKSITQSVTVTVNENMLSSAKIFSDSSVYEHLHTHACMCVKASTDASKDTGTRDGEALTCPDTITKSQKSSQWKSNWDLPGKKKKPEKTVVLCGLATIGLNTNVTAHPVAETRYTQLKMHMKFGLHLAFWKMQNIN